MQRPVDLIGCFKTKESNTAAAPTATYMTGPFEVSPTCKCGIKVLRRLGLTSYGEFTKSYEPFETSPACKCNIKVPCQVGKKGDYQTHFLRG